MTFPSFVQPEVPVLIPNVWLPNVPFVVAINTWGRDVLLVRIIAPGELAQSAARACVWVSRHCEACLHAKEHRNR